MSARRRALLCVAALPALVLLLACGSALQAWHSGSRAEQVLSDAQRGGQSVDEVESALGTSGELLDEAAAQLESVPVRLVSAVPGLGRSWRAERTTVAAARTAVQAATGLLADARALSVSGSTDGDSFAALARSTTRAHAEVRSAVRRVRALRLGGTPWLVGDRVEEALVLLDDLALVLEQGTRAAELGASVLGSEPRTMLISLMNNAELRGTGGYVATYALARVGGGAIEVEPFRDVISVVPEPQDAVKVSAPAEYVQDYGPFLADTTLWRNWTMSPDVPVSAEVGARAGSALLRRPIDLVLLMDVPALSQVLSLDEQSVVLDGREVEHDALLEALLSDEYARAGSTYEGQRARREELRRQAGAVLERLLTAGVSPARLAPLALRLASGRHLALWSSDAREQALVEELGLSGDADVPVDDDLSLVSANNLNANKLDFYMDRAVEVEVVVDRQGADVVQRVRFTNEAPTDVVAYVEGYETPGIARERVELSLGPRAQVQEVLVDGAPYASAVRHGQGRTRVAVYVGIDRQDPVEVSVRYRVPRDSEEYRLHVRPQPLAYDATLDLSIRAAEGLVLQQDGEDVPGGLLRVRGELDRSEVHAVSVSEDRGWLRAVQRWWSEPVRVPFR